MTDNAARDLDTDGHPKRFKERLKQARGEGFAAIASLICAILFWHNLYDEPADSLTRYAGVIWLGVAIVWAFRAYSAARQG